MIKLAVFDFDSTLMDGETIDMLAEDFGVGEEVRSITHRAMLGELDFFESLTKRVGFLRGMSEINAKKVCENLPLMPGAKECIAALKKNNIKVVCFSGGFSFATRYYARILGLSADFSNILHSKDGILTGKVGGDMMFRDSKGNMLARLQTLLNITPDETLAVGDGANDVSMFAYANKRVAFCAKPVLQKEANIIINQKDLCKILMHLDIA